MEVSVLVEPERENSVSYPLVVLVLLFVEAVDCESEDVVPVGTGLFSGLFPAEPPSDGVLASVEVFGFEVVLFGSGAEGVVEEGVVLENVVNVLSVFESEGIVSCDAEVIRLIDILLVELLNGSLVSIVLELEASVVVLTVDGSEAVAGTNDVLHDVEGQSLGGLDSGNNPLVFFWEVETKVDCVRGS